MATIKNLRDKWKALPIRQVIQQSIETTQGSFIELQKAQLHAGFNEDGSKIGDDTPYASELYAEKKEQQNPLPGFGNPDLFLTGKTYDGIELEIDDNAININSRDPKFAKLNAKYPFAFAGVGGKYKENYLSFLQTIIIKNTIKALS